MAKKAPPRFHTTNVSATKTANDIGELVHRYGAKMFSVTFDERREPASVNFLMDVPEVGEVPVSLTARVDEIGLRLPGRFYRDRAQATRVAWRQIKALVEMQLEAVENGLRPFHEAFMADVMIHAGGNEWKRLGAAYRESKGHLMLPAPTIDVDAEEVE